MIKLTHLGQQHKHPFECKVSPEYMKATVKCQIKVANYIKAHPNAFVFSEGLTENYNGIPSEAMRVLLRGDFFPDGLPNDAAELDELKQSALYEFGAAQIMNYLGELPRIYRTISPELSATIRSKVNSGVFSDVFTTREKAAMENVKEVIKQNPDLKEVILVFGNNHNFSKLCQEYGFDHEKINCCGEKSEEISADLVTSTAATGVATAGIVFAAAATSVATAGIGLANTKVTTPLIKTIFGNSAASELQLEPPSPDSHMKIAKNSPDFEDYTSEDYASEDLTSALYD